MVIEAEKSIGIMATLFAFIGGAIVFTIADIIAEKKGGGGGILLGIALDSIAESLVDLVPLLLLVLILLCPF